jgi:hypothetical protein
MDAKVGIVEQSFLLTLLLSLSLSLSLLTPTPLFIERIQLANLANDPICDSLSALCAP